MAKLAKHVEKNITSEGNFSRTIEMDCLPGQPPTVTIGTFEFDVAINLRFTFPDEPSALEFYNGSAEKIVNVENTESLYKDEDDEEEDDEELIQM